MTTTYAPYIPFVPSPVNFRRGIWREDDPAVRCAIRAAYRRERRMVGRAEARTTARSVAVALADYQQRANRG